MKQLFKFSVILSLASVVVFSLADNALAIVFDDDATTCGLWHMDTIEIADGLSYVADDNSTGRDAQPMELGGRPQITAATPTLTPGAPGMGNALLFDGVDDTARTLDQWPITDPDVLCWPPDADSASIDFLMRPDGLPPVTGDNFMGLVGVLPFQIYLQDDYSGNDTGRIVAYAFDENLLVTATVISQGGLALEEWHEVHADVTGSVVTLTVDGETTTGDMIQPLGTYYPSSAIIGRMVVYDIRHFQGALDEIRVATEPYASTLIPGDANEDGSVDVSDLGILATNYNAGSGFSWGEGDFTADGLVDVSDLGILATNYGMGTAAQAVPEPAALSLLLLGGVLVCGTMRLRNPVRRGR